MSNTNPPEIADNTSLSIDEAVRLYGVIQHFFEVAVHTVLYYRRLYPERAFGAVSAFGVPVRQCRHPAVCAWVRGAIEEIMRQLCGIARKGKQAARPNTKPKWQPRRLEDTTSLPPDRVNAVAILVHAPFEYEDSSDDEQGRDDRGADACDDDELPQSPSQSNVPLPAGAVLERWVFDVRQLPHGWPGGVQALRRARKDLAKRERQNRKRGMGRSKKPVGMLEDEADLSGPDSDFYNDYSDPDGDGDYLPGTGRVNWRDMEAQMSGIVMRLAQAGQQVTALPAGCTFTMAVELSDPLDDAKGGDPRRMDARRWIPEATKKRKFGGDRVVGAQADREGTGRGATTTVRSVDSAPLFLECWVEESSVKRAVTQGRSAQLALRPEDVLEQKAESDTDEEEEEEDEDDDDGQAHDQDDARSDSSDDISVADPDGPDAGPERPQPLDMADTESDMSFGGDVSFGDLINDSFGDGRF